MRKRITTIALAAALAASQAVISYAANSPGTGPVIGDNGGDSDYDIGERVGRVLGKGTIGTAQGVNTVQISRTGVTTNSKGQVIIEKYLYLTQAINKIRNIQRYFYHASFFCVRCCIFGYNRMCTDKGIVSIQVCSRNHPA